MSVPSNRPDRPPDAKLPLPPRQDGGQHQQERGGAHKPILPRCVPRIRAFAHPCRFVVTAEFSVPPPLRVDPS